MDLKDLHVIGALIAILIATIAIAFASIEGAQLSTAKDQIHTLCVRQSSGFKANKHLVLFVGDVGTLLQYDGFNNTTKRHPDVPKNQLNDLIDMESQAQAYTGLESQIQGESLSATSPC